MASTTAPQALSTGAEIRFTNAPGALAVVCANGGQGGDVAGTWSASIEWLVGELAPRFPALRFAEVKYRIKSWNRIDMCVEDVLAAVDEAGGARTLLVGFSMGGLVSVRAAPHPAVSAVLGLAPWFPDRLDMSPLRGRRLDVLHGSLDRWLPGIPGVSPTLSRRGFERARKLGVEGSYTMISGGVHGTALRPFWGGIATLPRAHRWAELSAAVVERFQASDD